MKTQHLVIALASLLATACSNNVTGQKERTVNLKSNIDSVSYGIGTDIGHNMKLSGLDSLNIDALAMGIQDGIDSTERISVENVRALVQGYMLKAQEKMMAREREEAEQARVAGEQWLLENAKKEGVQTTESGLQYEVLQMGDGPRPAITDQVKVNYKGTLIDGKEFDSSYKRGEPAVFGVGNVIAGWTEALTMMPKGSRWKLYIPSELAYGASRGPGGQLPPNSVLIFEVDLLDVMPGAPEEGR
ncbi:MAG: FKBP-type peptidyl-prolyl cis-trans isomerase [Flavobacteriales bacterium]|nr:FKBP-type peptidyl-prolyl cis-trans isomerase [Flavobacteriales bacterium]